MNGLSITLVFGKFAGVYFRTTFQSTRICLGWIAFTIYWQSDIETFISKLKEKIKELEKYKTYEELKQELEKQKE
jgi:cell shape-determining protein MreC